MVYGVFDDRQKAALLWQLEISSIKSMHDAWEKAVNAVSNKNKDHFNVCHHLTAWGFVNMYDLKCMGVCVHTEADYKNKLTA